MAKNRVPSLQYIVLSTVTIEIGVNSMRRSNKLIEMSLNSS